MFGRLIKSNQQRLEYCQGFKYTNHQTSLRASKARSRPSKGRPLPPLRLRGAGLRASGARARQSREMSTGRPTVRHHA